MTLLNQNQCIYLELTKKHIHMISSFDSRTANRFKKKESNKKLLMPSIPFPQISRIYRNHKF